MIRVRSSRRLHHVVLNFSRLDTACACTARLVHGGESRNQDWNYSDQQERRSASKAQLARHTTASSTLKETLMHARVPIASEKTRSSPTPPSPPGDPHDTARRSPQRSLFGRKSESSCSPTVPHVPRANHAAVTTLLLRACRQSLPLGGSSPARTVSMRSLFPLNRIVTWQRA